MPISQINTATTEIRGIHQSDVIIRTALVQAIADLRANPWLLDFVFASLAQDDLTNKVYGQKEITRAKEWFQKTEIPVSMDYRLDSPPAFFVSVGLVESVESENTLGDVHYVPAETQEGDWPALTGRFIPSAYDPATGIMTIPDAALNGLVLAPGMTVVTNIGKSYTITEVLENNRFMIATGLNIDFANSFIKSAKPLYINTIESASFRETYRIGCHVHGESSKLAWLYSIVAFILLRYRQELLEARSFERTSITTAPFTRDDNWGKENCWVRFINVTGYVRNYWPKNLQDAILSVTTQPVFVAKVGDTSETFITEKPADDPLDEAWLAQDSLGS